VKKVHAHKMVAATATKMAAAFYEACCSRSNLFYKQNPSAQAYVNATWHQFIEPARATLAEMLTQNHPEDLKESIADALIQDNLLRRGRGATNHVNH
jgi:hypothetical protein